jgi:hypothetical protein
MAANNADKLGPTVHNEPIVQTPELPHDVHGVAQMVVDEMNGKKNAEKNKKGFSVSTSVLFC